MWTRDGTSTTTCLTRLLVLLDGSTSSSSLSPVVVSSKGSTSKPFATFEAHGNFTASAFAARYARLYLYTFLEAAPITHPAPAVLSRVESHEVLCFSSGSHISNVEMLVPWLCGSLSLWLFQGRILWSAIPAENEATPASSPGFCAFVPQSFINQRAELLIDPSGTLVNCERST